MPDPDRVQRSRLDMARQASAPAAPPTGAERFYVDAAGALRKKSADGTDATAAGGDVGAHEADTTAVHGIADTSTLYRSGGTDVAVADGGTGASDAAGARTNLGLVIGTDVAAQSVDAAQGTGSLRTISSSAPSTQAFGDAASAGAGAAASPSTHKHAMPAAASLPGAELAYAEVAGNLSVTATTEGAAQTFVSAGAVTYDGGPVMIEVGSPSVRPALDAAGRQISAVLVVDGTSIGIIGVWIGAAAAADNKAWRLARRYTPSAGSHTILVAFFVSATGGSVGAGAGGAGANMPGYIRITKA